MLPPFPAAVPGAYSLEVQIYRGYWMVSWFKREFGLREQHLARERGVEPENLFDELVNQVPPGSMGLVLQLFQRCGGGGLVKTHLLHGTADQHATIPAGDHIAALAKQNPRNQTRPGPVQNHLAPYRAHRQLQANGTQELGTPGTTGHDDRLGKHVTRHGSNPRYLVIV